jgi:cell wall-associated NlpC family hydrolase
MTGKAIAGLITAILGVMVCCVGGLTLGVGSIAAAACVQPQGSFPATPSPSTSSGPTEPSVPGWNAEQIRNAATIVQVGAQLSVPPRGWVIAVATAMQESSLRNLGDQGANNDHDSLGLFQQRPSPGWGTAAQILDPVYASTQFYSHLLDIPQWQTLPLTVAAQDVQHSAYPDAYAKWEDDAVAVVNAVGPAATGIAGGDFTAWIGMCAALGGDGLTDSSSLPLPPGFTLPYNTPPAVAVALNWALAQLGTPYAFGGDCTNSHGGNPAHECDCSSLVQQAYRAAGISLPRTTSQQVHSGAAINPTLDALLPGDLLFIPGSDGTMSHPGHVALYLGGGFLIQSPHTGDVVKISKIDSWLGQLAAVRRVVK